VSDVFVLADSLSVLSADTGGVMKLWDAEHGTTRLSISGPVGHLRLARNSQLAVSGDLHDNRLVPVGADPVGVRGSGLHKNVVVGGLLLSLGPPRKFH